jgi:hypothetical protein
MTLSTLLLCESSQAPVDMENAVRSGLGAPAEVGTGLTSILRGRKGLPGVAIRSLFAVRELCAKEELDTTPRNLLRFAGALTGVADCLRAPSDVCDSLRRRGKFERCLSVDV